MIASEQKSKNLTQSNFYKKNYILKTSQSIGNDILQEANRVAPLTESLTTHIAHMTQLNTRINKDADVEKMMLNSG